MANLSLIRHSFAGTPKLFWLYSRKNHMYYIIGLQFYKYQ